MYSTEKEFLDKYQSEGIYVYKPLILQKGPGLEFIRLDDEEEMELAADLYYSGLSFMTPYAVDWIYGDLPIAILYHHLSPESNPEQIRYYATRFNSATELLESSFRFVLADGEFYRWILEDLGLFD